ncbi:hypothetical protein QQG55_19050 [Brugia pahangi]
MDDMKKEIWYEMVSTMNYAKKGRKGESIINFEILWNGFKRGAKCVKNTINSDYRCEEQWALSKVVIYSNLQVLDYWRVLVEKCELYMFLKNGQHYQILEFSIENVRHVFLVGFDEYFMILRRKVTPMFQQHTELPIAVVYFIILSKYTFYSFVFVHERKCDTIFIQLHFLENVRHDAFLLPEAYFNWFFFYVF